MPKIDLEDRIRGALIGGAVGDAMGSPFECLHKNDARRIAGSVQRFEDFTSEMLTEMESLRTFAITFGAVTDDSVLADLLLDAIFSCDGNLTAYGFAEEWNKFETPIPNPAGPDIIRLNLNHYVERIPYFRNKLLELNKRELGMSVPTSDNAIMYIAPVGLLCAGDPLKAELMAVDVTSVNAHGDPCDVAGGYAAAVAACFLPDATPESIVRTALEHVRNPRHRREISAIVDVGRECRDGNTFIDRYYSEIIDTIIPMRDAQSAGTNLSVTWNSSEILGPTLATLLITRGEDARAMVLTCAKLGRDADTIARCAGGLIGAFRGFDAIPREWADYVLARNRWLRLPEKAAQLAGIVRRNLERNISARQAVLQNQR